jgi:adenylosuccinate lyase
MIFSHFDVRNFTMIKRYTRPEMGAIWEDQNRYQKWLDVELAVCESWSELGEIPPEALQRIKEKASFQVERIDEIEKVVKHDVIAFLTSIAEFVGEDSRYVHLGLTSYDVVDTALSLLIKESLEKVQKDLKTLRDVIRDMAVQHKQTIMVGRTHGVHAEPITFGVKLLVWYEEIKRHQGRVARALDVISVGRISGSVGTYIHLDPKLEELALKKIGLHPAKVSTQVLQRDRHAEVVFVLSLICASLDKFAQEIRHLQKTETLELEEPFTKGQKGSSSMPHKKNPVRTERASGMARLPRGNLQVALENIPLWHERDISHSSAERIILPDSFIVTDFLLAEMTDIIRNWKVHPDRMEDNVNLTRGLVFSQRVLLALTDKELSREEAYKLVQRNSLKAWDEGKDFKDLLLSDKDVTARLTAGEIEECFSLDPYLGKIDYIFDKVLSDES